MSEVRLFHTHIEVYPYEQGDCKEIERMMSKFDTGTRTLIPVGYYIQNNILYLPRGINASILANFFKSTPVPVYKYDDYDKIENGSPLYDAKTKMQEDAIKFLLAKDEYSYSGRYSQLGLNLDTGDGKTYSAIYSILSLKIKSIIITHKKNLKRQWLETIEYMTDLPLSRVCDISGTDMINNIMKGKIEADIYIVNHQTLSAYARVHTWASIREFFKRIRVGIKVIDEAHKFFENSLMIDYFSNTYKSYYLTATFGRNDNIELIIYKKAYSNMVRFGEETINYEEKRKHVVLFIVYFYSHPKYGLKPRVRTRRGFSGYKYIDYELSEDNHSLVKVLHNILDNVSNLEGKILVTSPKVESVEYFVKDLKEYTGKEVGSVHSKNTDRVNYENMQKDIISSTIKSIGEGDNIKGLRVLINLTPIGSVDLFDQVRGRLREYSPDHDTFFFYPVDLSIQDCYDFSKRILTQMKKKCKEIHIATMNV